MKQILILVIAVVASSACFAQNWQKVSLTFNGGQTSEAEVNFEDWKISPKNIQVREGQSIKSYDASDLKSFTLIDSKQSYTLVHAKLRYYLDAPVEIDRSPVNREDSVAVYAEVLYVDNAVSLYSLQDAEQEDRYFIAKDGVTRELVHFTYNLSKGGKTYLTENNSFREQLKALLADCGVPISSELNYSERAIQGVLNKYAKCKGNTATVEKEEVRGLITIGLMGGQAFSSYPQFNTTFVDNMLGGEIQFLSRRSHQNNFIWIEVGVIPGLKGDALGTSTTFVGGLYGGRYFGKKKLQFLAYTGLSNTNRMFDTGVGVAFNKRIILSGGVGLLNYAVSLVRDEQTIYSTLKLKIYPRLKRK